MVIAAPHQSFGRSRHVRKKAYCILEGEDYECFCRLIPMKKKIAITIVAAVMGAVTIFLGVTQTTRLTQRIKHLEGDIARLESKVELFEAKRHSEAKSLRVLQVPKPPQLPNAVTVLPSPIQPAPNLPSAAIPHGWQPREFNGMTYYVVPLANESGQTMQLGSLK